MYFENTIFLEAFTYFVRLNACVKNNNPLTTKEIAEIFNLGD